MPYQEKLTTPWSRRVSLRFTFTFAFSLTFFLAFSLGLASCSNILSNPHVGLTTTSDLPISTDAPLSRQVANSGLPPIIFVHGNGDNAAVWHTTIWRFESNGWPRALLFPIDITLPVARNEDAKPQAGRSGTDDQMQELARYVSRVQQLTQAPKVILIGNSRGGYAIRNYVRNGGGKDSVLAVVLGGVPNHGVWSGDFNPGSEFNGAGEFLKQLNSPQGADGSEVTQGVHFLTLRSDMNDKFAQANGQWLGQPKLATGITSEGPALKGANNAVLPLRDHREVSFHSEAFAKAFIFLTGHAPRTITYIKEPRPILNGKILGLHEKGVSGEPSNTGFEGAKMSVYEVRADSGVRLGVPVHQQTVGADGLWGPFQARPDRYYEFVVEAPSFAITHIYRSPFARSSHWVHFRPVRLTDADKSAQAVVMMNRPRGYFGVGRDQMSLDGQTPPPGLAPGVPGISLSRLQIGDQSVRTAIVQFNAERIAVQTWPIAENHLVQAEFHD